MRGILVVLAAVTVIGSGAAGCGGSEFAATTADAGLPDDGASSESGGSLDAGGTMDGTIGDGDLDRTVPSDAPHADANVDGAMSSDGTTSDGATVDSAPDSGSVCTGQCIAPAPSGWTSVELYSAPSSQSAPACGTAYQGGRSAGKAGLHGSAATCGCTCGGATGVSCSLTSEEWCNNSTCVGGLSSVQFTGGQCAATACGNLALDLIGPTAPNTTGDSRLWSPTSA